MEENFKENTVETHQSIIDTHEQGNSDTESSDLNVNDNEEIAVLKDKYLRLYADFENFRKRNAKERVELIQSANKELMQALLPVLDDFDRAFRNLGDKISGDPTLEGFKLIHHKMLDIMVHKGLKPMEISIGKDFDVEFMEAVTNVPAPSEDLKGKVVDEIERGYILGDKVIRYAKVVVGE
ncbi:MAG: nucleotide exchange factor GrpE [Thermaurantimonas sp.]